METPDTLHKIVSCETIQSSKSRGILLKTH